MINHHSWQKTKFTLFTKSENAYSLGPQFLSLSWNWEQENWEQENWEQAGDGRCISYTIAKWGMTKTSNIGQGEIPIKTHFLLAQEI